MGAFSESKPGFQRSDTTSVEVTIYPQGRDPILFTDNKALTFTKVRPAIRQRGLVTGVNYSSNLGEGSGSWSVTLKPGALDVFDSIVDDDWCDIVFKKFNRQWHLVRGLVKDIRRSRIVSGATSRSFVISGRGWSHIFEMTPIWFDRFTTENLAGSAAYRVLPTANIGGTVAQVVRAFLDGFLQELNNLGRFNWKMPDMPGIIPGSGFLENVSIDTSHFKNDPARIAVTPSFMQPSGNAWELAQQWSDPFFCELFPSLKYQTSPFDSEHSPAVDGVGPEASPLQTEMAVILRDRPFPTTADDGEAWSKLPLFVVPRQSIAGDEVGRGGNERYNAYFLGPQMTQEMIGTHVVELCRPIWYVNDIKRHGLRRFDISTNYLAEEGKSLFLADTLRERLMNWYCLNPYFYNGQLTLTHGRPDIHEGSRVRIPGNIPEEDEIYYVEGVSHEWAFGRGIRTALTVTRGWRGTEASLMTMIHKLSTYYESPKEPVTAGPE